MTEAAKQIVWDDLLLRYRQLLEGIDLWFLSCTQRYPDQVKCSAGCSACCRGLFEISLLDAALLQQGFKYVDKDFQETALAKSRSRRDELQHQWPDLEHPYILNRLATNDWEEMPEDDPTPCPLVDEDGFCRVYQHRPLICRLHGLPNVDESGKIFMAEYCNLNFPGRNATRIKSLRYCFHSTYNREFDLLAEFSRLLLGKKVLDLDTFVPLALLIDFSAISETNF